MANVRVVSFAAEGTPCPDAPFTFFYRLNTGKRWLSRGLQDTTNLKRILKTELNKICKSRRRTLLRTDDGSGAEITIKDMVELIKHKTTLGKGTLDSIYVVAYPKNPIIENAKRQNEKTSCCALQ